MFLLGESVPTTAFSNASQSVSCSLIPQGPPWFLEKTIGEEWRYPAWRDGNEVPKLWGQHATRRLGDYLPSMWSTLSSALASLSRSCHIGLRGDSNGPARIRRRTTHDWRNHEYHIVHCLRSVLRCVRGLAVLEEKGLNQYSGEGHFEQEELRGLSLASEKRIGKEWHSRDC